MDLKAAAAAALLLLAGPARAGDWPTFGGSPQRLGYVADETVLSPSTVPSLQLHWKRKLGGYTNEQPDFLSQVPFPAGAHDEVYITTGNGYILAINAGSGAIDWKVSLGASPFACQPGNVGIRNTPTIDRARGLLYVVSRDSLLHALSILSGQEATGFPLRLLGSSETAYTYSRSSPAEIGSMLYITTGAHCESSTIEYHGQVIEVDLNQPAVVKRFFPAGNSLAVNGGGIWGSGGLSVEWDGSALYGATANAFPAATDGLGENVLALSPNLQLLAANLPPLPPEDDIDFGTTPVLIDAPSCPPLLAAMNKSGEVFLYNRTAIGSGPLQVIDVSQGNGSSDFIGLPAYDPTAQTLFISNPISSADGNFPNGVIALQLDPASCLLTSLWNTPAGTGRFSPSNRSRTPAVANGVVWVGTGTGLQLLAIDEILGTELWNSGTILGTLGAANAPIVANGQVFIAAGNTLYAFGL